MNSVVEVTKGTMLQLATFYRGDYGHCISLHRDKPAYYIADDLETVLDQGLWKYRIYELCDISPIIWSEMIDSTKVGIVASEINLIGGIIESEFPTGAEIKVTGTWEQLEQAFLDCKITDLIDYNNAMSLFQQLDSRVAEVIGRFDDDTLQYTKDTYFEYVRNIGRYRKRLVMELEEPREEVKN